MTPTQYKSKSALPFFNPHPVRAGHPYAAPASPHVFDHHRPPSVTGAGHALARFSIQAPIQLKSEISQPDDTYEQEADQVADAVMRAPESGTAGSVSPDLLPAAHGATGLPVVQRQAAEATSTAVSVGAAGGQSMGLGRAHTPAASSAGQALPPSVRVPFEQRFGLDFSKVRIHTDSRAAESAQALRARAYTQGADIVFGAGQFRPQSGEGRHLLAHELTHVVQQSAGRPRSPPSSAKRCRRPRQSFRRRRRACLVISRSMASP